MVTKISCKAARRLQDFFVAKSRILADLRKSLIYQEARVASRADLFASYSAKRQQEILKRARYLKASLNDRQKV